MVNFGRALKDAHEGARNVFPQCVKEKFAARPEPKLNSNPNSTSSSTSTSGIGESTNSNASVTVTAMHERPELMEDVALLINSEWPRSMGARLAQLRSSSDQLPTSLLLLKNDLVVLGHLKLTPIGSQPDCCFVESVVVARDCRGQGLGSLLMRHAELYCMSRLRLNCIYLSTVDQMNFYAKLGYTECEPVSIYGNANFRRPNPVNGKKVYMKRSLVD